MARYLSGCVRRSRHLVSHMESCAVNNSHIMGGIYCVYALSDPYTAEPEDGTIVQESCGQDLTSRQAAKPLNR